MAKRQQNEMWKKQMLRNLHMFISLHRLCVHNIPPTMSDKQLKKIFLTHSPEGAKITEVSLFSFKLVGFAILYFRLKARIMRDLKAVGDGKTHPSKGYGFVAFVRHEDALHALRNINNNPTIFSTEKVHLVHLVSTLYCLVSLVYLISVFIF